MVIVFNHCNTKPFKPTESMELADLEHNEKLLLKQIALLKEKISIYSKQLRETKKQIKKHWKEIENKN